MTTSDLFSRPRILCFVDYYLPGYKAGGPLRTIANMVSQLGGEVEFLIVTRDRDFLDSVPYHNVFIDQWNAVGQAKVFYASHAMLSFRGVMNLLNKTPHEILYLNSFFSPVTTVLPLILRRLGLYGKCPVILAPRGEFSVGALGLKAIKKKIYIALTRMTGIYRQLIWQSSSALESEDILRTLPNIAVASNIMVAPDLLPLPVRSEVATLKISARTPGPLRIVFLSRISAMKNLDYLLRALSKVNVGVALTICGPAEDSVYWLNCQSLIQTLPSHITVTYQGEVLHEQVSQTFAAHDVFIFPTRGENFGHVIYESLVAGTAVIVSDQTPWQADPHGAVVVLSLENPDVWTSVINQRAGFNDEAYATLRTAAVCYSIRYMETSKAVEQNRSLFLSALEHSRQ
jgi:glycosyltransferase involved in cell wall biosynthesis